jgi:hypothetical protein
MKKKDDRKSSTVWLKPRHLEMLKALPDMSVGDLTRKAIEDAFEGRTDREYARMVVEDDLDSVMAEWGRVLGLVASCTVTSTEDGFRVVVVAQKKFDNG